MRSIPLVTSVPPHMARTADGVDIGERYRSLCIDSWTRCGFVPVSVNARAELAGHSAVAEGVDQVTADEDASEITGKPLAYLRDLVRAARDHGDGPAVIANADILLDPDSGIRGLVADLAQGHVLVARRMDVANPGHLQGTEYGQGFDLFAAHREDLEPLERSRLVFGAPWWDHYVPLRLLAGGSKLVFAERPLAEMKRFSRARRRCLRFRKHRARNTLPTMRARAI